MCNNGLTIKINLFWSKRFEDGRCTYKNTGSSHLKFHVSNSLSNIIIPQDSLEPGGRKRNTWKFNGQMGLMMLQVYAAIESTFPIVLQYVINSDLGALSSWFESEIELFLSQRSLENGSAIVAITIWKRLSSDGSDHSTDNDRWDWVLSQRSWQSQRLHGNHYPAMARMVAIAGIVATAKIPICIAYAHPFQGGWHHWYREIIGFGTFYGQSAKVRLPLQQIFHRI